MIFRGLKVEGFKAEMYFVGKKSLGGVFQWCSIAPLSFEEVVFIFNKNPGVFILFFFRLGERRCPDFFWGDHVAMSLVWPPPCNSGK